MVPGKPESGNPAAVVLEQGLGRVLSEDERRAIAADLNQPVTVFVATTKVVSPKSVVQVRVGEAKQLPWPMAQLWSIISIWARVARQRIVCFGTLCCPLPSFGNARQRSHIYSVLMSSQCVCNTPRSHTSLRKPLTCHAAAQVLCVYTPTGVELELCGHGTLAAAAVLHAHPGTVYSESFSSTCVPCVGRSAGT